MTTSAPANAVACSGRNLASADADRAEIQRGHRENPDDNAWMQTFHGGGAGQNPAKNLSISIIRMTTTVSAISSGGRKIALKVQLS